MTGFRTFSRRLPWDVPKAIAFSTVCRVQSTRFGFSPKSARKVAPLAHD
jgi:hypothetical protein